MIRCHSVSCPRSVLISGLRVADDIPYPSNGMNETRLVRQLNLLSKMIDEHIDDVRQAVPGEAPHVLGNHLPCERVSGMSHEMFQQLEFLGGEVDAAVPSLYDARDRVEAEVCHVRGTSPGSRCLRSNARTLARSSVKSNGFVR